MITPGLISAREAEEINEAMRFIGGLRNLSVLPPLRKIPGPNGQNILTIDTSNFLRVTLPSRSGAISGSGSSTDAAPTIILGTVVTGQECIGGVTYVTTMDLVSNDGYLGFENAVTTTAGCCDCPPPCPNCIAPCASLGANQELLALGSEPFVAYSSAIAGPHYQAGLVPSEYYYSSSYYAEYTFCLPANTAYTFSISGIVVTGVTRVYPTNPSMNGVHIEATAYSGTCDALTPIDIGIGGDIGDNGPLTDPYPTFTVTMPAQETDCVLIHIIVTVSAAHEENTLATITATIDLA